MLINLSIFSMLWLVLRKKGGKDGFTFAAYIAMYSAGRFFVEQFRADSLMAGNIRAAQAVSVSIFVAACAIIIWKRLWANTSPKAAQRGKR